MKARILLSILVVVLAAISMPTSALAGKPGDNYARLAVDLARFHALRILQGDYERGITFNAALARQYGFSEPAIRLGEQVAAVTHELADRRDQTSPAQRKSLSDYGSVGRY